MRTDDAKVCEGIIRDFPKIRASLRMLEQMALGSSMDGERVDGGTKLPEQQRVVEDVRIAELSKIVETVNTAVRDLPGHLQRAVILVYFLDRRFDWAADELNCDHVTVRRWCRRAIEIMRHDLARLYEGVSRWRDDWEKDITDSLK